MTPLSKVYDVFFSKMTDDEYENWTEEEVYADCRYFLDSAIMKFKFPRKSLEIENDNFIETLSNSEIQILAAYMKCEWLNRTILRWDNIKPLYDERDFSQANLLNQFRQNLNDERKNAEKLEAIYYRSINGKPFDYTKLAGKN